MEKGIAFNTLWIGIGRGDCLWFGYLGSSWWWMVIMVFEEVLGGRGDRERHRRRRLNVSFLLIILENMPRGMINRLIGWFRAKARMETRVGFPYLDLLKGRAFVGWGGAPFRVILFSTTTIHQYHISHPQIIGLSASWDLRVVDVMPWGDLTSWWVGREIGKSSQMDGGLFFWLIMRWLLKQMVIGVVVRESSRAQYGRLKGEWGHYSPTEQERNSLTDARERDLRCVIDPDFDTEDDGKLEISISEWRRRGRIAPFWTLGPKERQSIIGPFTGHQKQKREMRQAGHSQRK